MDWLLLLKFNIFKKVRGGKFDEETYMDLAPRNCSLTDRKAVFAKLTTYPQLYPIIYWFFCVNSLLFYS
ncbi:MAG TPA: hypothetical protein DDW65_03445 [Firmicutes bacterium]|nr:hypothetical protein [Bacillota bacterium]